MSHHCKVTTLQVPRVTKKCATKICLNVTEPSSCADVAHCVNSQSDATVRPDNEFDMYAYGLTQETQAKMRIKTQVHGILFTLSLQLAAKGHGNIYIDNTLSFANLTQHQGSILSNQDNKQLYSLGLQKDCTGRVVWAINHRQFGAVDVEHMLCKVYLCLDLDCTCGNRSMCVPLSVNKCSWPVYDKKNFKHKSNVGKIFERMKVSFTDLAQAEKLFNIPEVCQLFKLKNNVLQEVSGGLGVYWKMDVCLLKDGRVTRTNLNRQKVDTITTVGCPATSKKTSLSIWQKSELF